MFVFLLGTSIALTWSFRESNILDLTYEQQKCPTFIRKIKIFFTWVLKMQICNFKPFGRKYPTAGMYSISFLNHARED